ncbi:MAG: hypothetical protein ABWZ30_04460 [Jiangellaceae bacterium]
MSTTNEELAMNEAAVRTADLAEAISDVDAIQTSTPSIGGPPPRRRSRRAFSWALAASLAGVIGLAVAFIVEDRGASPATQIGHTPVGDAKDHPNYGPISPVLEPALRTRDDVVRDLVERGAVPAATLDDGSQITGRGPR